MNSFVTSFAKFGLFILPLSIVLVGFAPKAEAVYPCPGAGPGEVVVGMTDATNGVASVPLCDTDPNYQDYPSSSSPSYYDPESAALEFQNAATLLQLQQQTELLQDPDYLRYLSGSWSLYPTSLSASEAPGEYCVASFFKASMDTEANDAPVLINLSGPGGDFDGALLTFATEAIPKPEAIQMIKVTLFQNDYPPATVQAFNYSTPDLPYGVISFAVPTIEAALETMEDAQHFDVKIDGRSVANTTWHSGLQVRDEFRRCLAGQPYLATEIDIVPDNL